MTKKEDFCTLGLAVIETEAQALFDLTQQLDSQFAKACDLLLACRGHVIVMGVGKSGHIGNKIAATLASTGTPAFFVHPTEACHGDMGVVTNNDCVLMLSNSGQTQECLALLPLIKRLSIPLISLTGNPESTLATNATVNINVSVKQEACPLGLAPTTSTTAALVMGDALAIALLQARGFSAEDFAISHPGGSLGRKLLLHIDELYHRGEQLPIVTEQALLSDALIEISEKKLGMTCIVNSHNQLLGVFTDGDLRRALAKQVDIHQTKITTCMNTSPKTIQPGLLAADALNLFEENNITTLVVTDDKQDVLGVLHLHDILKAGVA